MGGDGVDDPQLERKGQGRAHGMNLYAAFAESWGSALDRPALVDATGNGPDFGELDMVSAGFAAALKTRGVTRGDRVAAQVGKSVGAVALYLGCLRMGAIFVPLNTGYTAAEIAYFVEDSEPALFVSDTVLADLRAEAEAATPDAGIADLGEDEIAAILYTSGTTGRSKGAMLSHGNLLSNARALNALWGVRPDDVLIHALPVFHVHGLFIALNTMFLGAATSWFLPKFDASQVRALMPRATILMGVPTFYTRLLADPDFGRDSLGTMRLFVSGSAPLLAETHRAFEARTGQRILERYGMTEAGVIASNPLDGERIAGTVGYALPGLELRIADAEGKALAVGETGTVEIRGPGVFRGYWRNPEKTAEDIRPDGWFITGDVGTLDAQGRLTIAGRAKDLIIAGGYNIYPKEIEAVIDFVPGVIESAVIGVPHPDLGEGVVAVVAGNSASEPAIRDAVTTELARFKHPRAYIFVDDLPRNAMGKVQKNLLRETYRTAFDD
jgi:malonyl-CoA/methylmalonyl-CoA synthetase